MKSCGQQTETRVTIPLWFDSNLGQLPVSLEEARESQFHYGSIQTEGDL